MKQTVVKVAQVMSILFGFVAGVLLLCVEDAALASVHNVPVIFDTDMGNDIDDALALGMLHGLESRRECRLIAVTITKDNEWAAPYVDLVNAFYGRPTIPIGVVRSGKTPEDSPYIRVPSQAMNGSSPRYPRRLKSGRDAPEAVRVLRQALAREADQSVIAIQVGFSTNFARLLDSPPDESSPLAGRDLVAKKVKLLSMMAGNFSAAPTKEYNVFVDVDAARKVLADWPTPVVLSGYEVGEAVTFPAINIERDFNYVPHHPLAEAYRLYQKFPYDRQTWDLTSVLFAVRPDFGYFALSPIGTVTVDDQQVTHFKSGSSGRHRYLSIRPERVDRVREAMTLLASQPPSAQP